MLPFVALLLVQSLAGSYLALAASTPSCIPGILGPILDPIANDPEVKSYCYSKFPRAATTTTTTISATATATTTVTAQTTVTTSTSVTSSSTTTVTVTASTTVTDSPTVNKRSRSLCSSVTTTTTTTKTNKLAPLTSLASSVVSSFCTCIQPLRTSTVSSTKTGTVTATATTTTTITQTNTITITNIITTTLTTTTTFHVTPTTTTTTTTQFVTPTCDSKQRSACGGNCQCSIGHEDGVAYCFASTACGDPKSPCKSNSDCASGYYCTYDNYQLCYGVTVCVSSQGYCSANTAGPAKRQLEKVFDDARNAQLSRRARAAITKDQA